MAISRMKRLSLLVPKSESAELMNLLLRLHCVEVDTAEAEDGSASRFSADGERTEYERKAARADEALTVLHKRSRVKKRPFAQGPEFDFSGFEGSAVFDRGQALLTGTESALAALTENKSEETKNEAAILSYRSWLPLDVPLNMEGTRYTLLWLGTLPDRETVRQMQSDLYEDFGAVLTVVQEEETAVYCAVLLHRDDSEGASRVLSAHGFNRFRFSDTEGTAAQALEAAEKKREALRQEAEAQEDRLRALAADPAPLEILSDYWHTCAAGAAAKGRMAQTAMTVCMEAWVPEESEKKVSRVLDKLDCAYEMTDPAEGDDPPILLKNNWFARNFEWVLGMYSYPAYGRFDPTFIMSIFYFIIFGLMFADAGYGLLLVLFGFGAVKLFNPGRGMRSFLLMFGWCGLSSMIWGILLGAYFGDLPNAFATNMLHGSGVSPAILFDPLKDPMSFLILSLGVGAVHLLAGMAVKFYILCRDGRVADALMDVGSWWVLFAGLGLLFAVPSVGKWVTIAGAALLILTQGREAKNPVMKLLKGVMSLYDLISYISDLLSYSRILALGLASAVIAQVVNILGTMGGPTVVGFIGLLLAMTAGHLLNLAINVLGTFVHTSRLQYIEFFGKFYEDGGRPFRALTPTRKYTSEIEDDPQ